MRTLAVCIATRYRPESPGRLLDALADCAVPPDVIPAVDGFGARPDFCCLIASNKAVAAPDSRELYSERVNAIRWFEQHAPPGLRALWP